MKVIEYDKSYRVKFLKFYRQQLLQYPNYEALHLWKTSRIFGNELILLALDKDNEICGILCGSYLFYWHHSFMLTNLLNKDDHAVFFISKMLINKNCSYAKVINLMFDYTLNHPLMENYDSIYLETIIDNNNFFIPFLNRNNFQLHKDLSHRPYIYNCDKFGCDGRFYEYSGHYYRLKLRYVPNPNPLGLKFDIDDDF